MPKHLQNDLERLKKAVLEIGTRVEENLTHAIASLTTRDRVLAARTIDGDREIDRREVLIEEECLKILALHQPVAKDLRFVVAILKLNNDLERVGDLAVNIAQRTLSLTALVPVPIPDDLAEMAQKARAMLRKSFDALIESDAQMAREVCAADDAVDRLHRDLFQMLQNEIKKSPQLVEEYVHLLSVTRYLERVADQATNIAEDVIYMVEGTVVRHHIE
ncbi:phosphate signaling complex protein PhoU [candidate division KSB1 bacterium]|nr:MAG: phosphate signaling complex protein PhoU [candidate division KSB1 bacterium]